MIEAFGSTPSIEIYLEPQCHLIVLHVCGWSFFDCVVSGLKLLVFYLDRNSPSLKILDVKETRT